MREAERERVRGKKSKRRREIVERRFKERGNEANKTKKRIL